MMATIDLTLNGFIVPRIPTFTPPWGTIQTDPDHSGLSTGEAVNNMMMPLNRMRPFTVTENSATTIVEADSTIVLAGSASSLALGPGAYIGCKLTIINQKSDVVIIIDGPGVLTLYGEESLYLFWTGAAWKPQQCSTMPPGVVVSTAIPTQAQRAANRLLDLAGDAIPVAGPYAHMVANVYCGDALNDTAPSYYRCTDQSKPNDSRSTTGAYMKLPDCRGIFMRGAGQNGEHTMAGGTPYDGKAIGEFVGDAIQNITGKLSAGGGINMVQHPYGFAPANNPASAIYTQAAYTGTNRPAGTDAKVNNNHEAIFDASRVVRTAAENRPASISAYYCITY
jgi:hypothetical protein